MAASRSVTGPHTNTAPPQVNIAAVIVQIYVIFAYPGDLKFDTTYTTCVSSRT